MYILQTWVTPRWLQELQNNMVCYFEWTIVFISRKNNSNLYKMEIKQIPKITVNKFEYNRPIVSLIFRNPPISFPLSGLCKKKPKWTWNLLCPCSAEVFYLIIQFEKYPVMFHFTLVNHADLWHSVSKLNFSKIWPSLAAYLEALQLCLFVACCGKIIFIIRKSPSYYFLFDIIIENWKCTSTWNSSPRYWYTSIY